MQKSTAVDLLIVLEQNKRTSGNTVVAQKIINYYNPTTNNDKNNSKNSCSTTNSTSSTQKSQPKKEGEKVAQKPPLDCYEKIWHY